MYYYSLRFHVSKATLMSRLWCVLPISAGNDTATEMISLVDVSKACKGSKDTLRKGEQYFRSGLMCVGIIERKDFIIKCVGLAAQTPGVLQNPHRIECDVNLNEEEGDMVARLNCSCPVGSSSRCEHCIALLIYLNRVESENLDDLTCTVLEQRWEVIKGSHLKAQETYAIAEMGQLETSKELTVSKEMRDKWRKILMNCQ